MNKIEQWLNAIINEDAHRLSAGSLRTIEMIRRELARQQKLQQCNVSGSLPLDEFLEDVKHMQGLYGKNRYTQAEQKRDELAERLDDIMRLGGNDR